MKHISPHVNIRNVGIAALAGIGYYAYRKKTERDPYADVFARMPLENGHGVGQLRMDVPLTNRSVRMPQQTAGLVGMTERMRTGHTRMGADKYNYMYGGYV